jgi:hypothetical protein
MESSPESRHGDDRDEMEGKKNSFRKKTCITLPLLLGLDLWSVSCECQRWF